MISSDRESEDQGKDGNSRRNVHGGPDYKKGSKKLRIYQEKLFGNDVWRERASNANGITGFPGDATAHSVNLILPL
jgi:hypothetical protein